MSEEITILVGLDKGHVDEFKTAWESWQHNRPQVLKEKLLFVCDLADGDWHDWSRRLEFCKHPKSTAVMWDGEYLRAQGADQREVMLTALVWAAAQIDTKHYVKIDTDTVARKEGVWVKPEWLDESLAFVSCKWGYTRPSSMIRSLDEWAATVPSLASFKPPLGSLPDDPEAKVWHRRIQSFWLLGTTSFARTAWELVGESRRMPCPSQDTYLWYVAERLGWPYKRHNFRGEGWQHGRGALRSWRKNGVA